MMIFSIYLDFCPSVINTQESDCFLFLCFLKTVEIAEIRGLLRKNVLTKMLHPHENRLLSGFSAGGKANMRHNGPASAPVATGDVCPADCYGNEVTQMFRKKNPKTKQDAKTEIIAIKTLIHLHELNDGVITPLMMTFITISLQLH